MRIMLKKSPLKPSIPIPLTKQALTTLLNSCSANSNHLNQIHALLLTTGYSIKNSLLTHLLLNFIHLGNMHDARQLFDEMHKPRVFLWNTLIKAYVQNDMYVDSFFIYRDMHCAGIRPDNYTFPFVLKACSGLGEVCGGLSIHCNVVKNGIEFVSMVRNELMLMYFKFGKLGSAEFLFRSMVERDLVAWNAFIAGCVEMGEGGKALALFCEMGVDGMVPDCFTLVSVLSACGQLGCLERGNEIYKKARSEETERNLIVQNARLDMFMKCGGVDMARALFEEMPKRNVVSWSTMVVGFAVNGKSEEALALFSRMQKEGPKPNHVTYLGVLSACSHGGLVSQGRSYFKFIALSNDKIIQPRKEHYACMVDLLGRSGHLEEAYEFILSMPIKPDSGVWGALLGACAIHKNVDLGQVVANKLFQLSPDIASYQVLLSNMYASAGRWDLVDELRQRMRERGVKKVGAYSTIEFDDEIHIFYGGDKSHPQSTSIYHKLENLYAEMRSLGYISKTYSVYHDVEMEEKETMLRAHSEKLAVAFGLINFRPDYPIRIMKNLRTCDDCHNFCKFVSKITTREIIMRDNKRFHHFKDGLCSCKDFW